MEERKGRKRLEKTQIVVILDFGSQYTQLIARRVRELGVFSVIHPFDADFAAVRALKPIALVLSGGPSSVYDPGAPELDARYLDLEIPVLGICYGMQQVIRLRGGKVERGERGGE